MNIYDAIQNRRSIRKFTQEPIAKEKLLQLVDCARMAAYPANVQPLKFKIIDDVALLKEVFPCTRWAGYLENGTPTQEERPTAYILMLGDTSIIKYSDYQVEVGAAGATMTLAATGAGIASCWLGALNREKLREILNIPEHLIILDMIALGYPAQRSQAILREQGVIKYYLGEENVLQVPKRSLEEVLY